MNLKIVNHIETLIYDFIKNVNNVSFDFVNTLNTFNNVKHHLTQLIAVKGGWNLEPLILKKKMDLTLLFNSSSL